MFLNRIWSIFLQIVPCHVTKHIYILGLNDFWLRHLKRGLLVKFLVCSILPTFHDQFWWKFPIMFVVTWPRIHFYDLWPCHRKNGYSWKKIVCSIHPSCHSGFFFFIHFLYVLIHNQKKMDWSKLKEVTDHKIKSLPNFELFRHSEEKILCKMKKLLVTSNFFIVHNVFSIVLK